VATLPAHVLHSYFNFSPESPDGRWVLAFVSPQPDAHVGDLCLFARNGSEQRVLARGLEVEDSHRQACQQFIDRGRAVAFHHCSGGQWLVESVEIDSGQRRVLAQRRQLGFNRPDVPHLLTMPLHWESGGPSDGDLHVIDGEGRVLQAVPLEAIRPHAARLLERPDLLHVPAALAFPLLSPDGARLACKLSLPAGTEMRSMQASQRQGLFVYDLAARQVRGCASHWGHPAWHPDSRRLVTALNGRLQWCDSDTGELTPWLDTPEFPGSHPSFCPHGRRLVTDTVRLEDDRQRWDVAWLDLESGAVETLFSQRWQSPATTSWRPAHPHAVFSPDGRRIYFNAMHEGWMRLCVAEV
jgi:hypothetical protein